MTRNFGISSHSSNGLADALEDYPYDCVLILLNAARDDMEDPEDVERFFRLAQENDVGVIAMKVVAHSRLIERGVNIDSLFR